MKQTTTKIGRLLVVCLWMLLSYSSNAQNPTYELYVTNQLQTDPKTYQFDVYLLRTGSTDLVLYGVQFGLGIDTSISNGGTLSYTYVSGSTQLNATQAAFTNQFVTTYFNVGGVIYRYFNQSAVAASTTNSATLISGVKNGCSSPGTRLGTYRITNTVNFKPASTCKHIFTGTAAASGRTATKVSAWVNGSVVDITAGTANGGSSVNYTYSSNGTCDQNLSLNGCEVLASVSSQTAVTCFGGSNGTATISLSGLGTASSGTYKLDGGSSVSYSSNPFTVSNLSAGTHTISVSSGICSASTGNFTINAPSSALTSSFSANGCGSYTLPWGGSVSTSGVYTHTYQSARGCDSTVTANITINQANSSSQSASACVSYTWNATTYTTSGTYTKILTNAGGCDSTAILNLTITQQPAQPSVACYETATWNLNTCQWDVTGTQPTQPTVACYETATFNTTTCQWDVTGSQPQQPTIACYETATFNTTTCQWDVTGSPIVSSFDDAACYTYTLPWDSTVNTSGSYTHVYTTGSGCDSTVTANITINTATSSTTNYAACISAMPYFWNGIARAAAGTYTYTTSNANGCDSVATLVLVVSTVTPGAPTAVTQTLVSNNCGARVYRYSVTAVANAVGYAWTLPTSVGGVSGVTVDSGDITRDRVIKLMYASNAAAITTDSIKVRAWSGCGNSATKGFKLTNAAWAGLAAPTITTTNVNTTTCGGRRVRYSIAQPATTSGAVSVEWSFVGSVLGANATIDSGTSSSRVIVVLYTSNLAASANDSVRVRYNYNDGCSYGANVRSKIGLIAYLPATPAAPSITLLSNVCDAKTYRYRAAALTSSTATTPAATGWLWSFTGTLGANAVIDSGDANSQVIVVRYTSNAAAGTTDSVRVCYTSDCGNGANGKAKLTNVATRVPAAPTGVTITAVAPSVCGAKVYRYAAPALVNQTATTAAATGWLWSFTGTLGANATIDSGDVNSRVIRVIFSSNVAAVTVAGSGDSVRVAYLSSCGNSVAKAAKLTNVVTTIPAAPTSITITALQTNVCGARKYRYAAPVILPVATATAAAATGWLWSFSNTTLGNNAVIDSGDASSKVITVTYTSNAAAGATDSVKLQYTSSCGNSIAKAAKLSNAALVTPTPATAPTIQIVSDICGERRYRYTAPALVSSTATAPAATGWLWSFTGTLGGNAVIDSGDATSQKIVVRYTVYTAGGVGDSVRVAFTSGCGTSANKSTKLSNVARTCTTPANLPVTKAPVVNTPTESMSVKVFPNPSTTNFNVQVITAGNEEVSVRVLDLQGRFIKSVKVASGRTLNIGSELKAGAYFIEVRQGREVKTTRVIKF